MKLTILSLTFSLSMSMGIAKTLIYAVPPSGFYLQPSDKQKRGELYGPTMPASEANWNLSQWDIPDELPPFNKANTTQNKWAKVSFVNHVLSITENSTNYPCIKLYANKNLMPKEWGMFAAPNSKQEAAFPQGIKSKSIPLSELNSVNLTTTVFLKQLKIIDTACPVNKAFLVVNVVLTNIKSKQTFFYGVSFNNFISEQSTMFKDKGVLNTQSHGHLYFNGINRESGQEGIYAYGEQVDVYGSPRIDVSKKISYNLNIYPGLLRGIRSGSGHNLDQDLNDWALGGVYEGQTITGHVFIKSEWSNFLMTVETKH